MNILEGFVSESDLIDWSSPDLDADLITRGLIGSCRHWAGENRPGWMIGKGELEIELAILRKAGWKRWDTTSIVGKPMFRHLLAVIKLLMPATDITPALADAVKLFCKSLHHRGKGLHLIGSQNSGKTGMSVRIAFAVMAVFPKESAIFFANPFDSAADSTIWGEVEECYDEIMLHWPELFPASVKYALKKIELVPNIPKAGTLELRNVKHVGKFKGTKTLKTGEVMGIILVVIDEVNEILNHAFLKILSNITSQEGFMSITSQNFKDPYDMGGRLTEPSGKHGGPKGFRELDKEVDHFWNSYGSSITMRLNGLKSPNILAGRVIYSYLFTKENLDYMIETYGEDSPEFYSQVLSFPLDGENAKSALPKSRINASRHDDPFYTVIGPMTKIAFCDPSFGGGDRAMYGNAEWGKVAFLDAHGNRHVADMIVAGAMTAINVTQNMRVTPELRQRMVSAGIDPWKYKDDREFTVEDQIALVCREWNQNNGVKAENFGYDFSMRPDIVMSMVAFIGPSTVAFDYNTKPVNYYIHSLRQHSEDACRMRVDELAFLTSDIFANQRYRAGGRFEVAILQAGRTRYEIRLNKRIVEKKKEYKGRWNNQSPDERDTLWGLTGMAYRSGFRIAAEPTSIANPAPHPGSSSVTLKQLNKFGLKRGKKLPTLR